MMFSGVIFVIITIIKDPQVAAIIDKMQISAVWNRYQHLQVVFTYKKCDLPYCNFHPQIQ